ncbi:hypothetical protein [Halegenticoccus tardaugens]|uniref:hypothetical protein n=1 Tax=Halegenticoccus tardaugens TaxID=2071624 RepID=UPI0013E92F30|nr:hypothetical protein [Halegenticoccus tardaugens]
MIESLRRFTLFALYQTTVVVGILLLPVAVLARRAGVSLPVGRLIETLEAAYDDADSN